MWSTWHTHQRLIDSPAIQWLHTPVQRLVLLQPCQPRISLTMLCTRAVVCCSSPGANAPKETQTNRKKRRLEYFRRMQHAAPTSDVKPTEQPPPGTAARPLQAKAPDEPTNGATDSTEDRWELVQVARTKPARPRVCGGL